MKKVEFGQHFKKFAGLFLALFLIYLAIGFTVIYRVSAKQTNDFLGRIIETASKKLKYQDGKWNTSLYDNDPEIPGSYRLYVLSNDGYVIDRWRPISGLLDTSEFKQLDTHSNKLNTLTTITNQKWRMLSLPITNARNQKIGIVALGKLITSHENINEIDSNLQKTGQDIIRNIQVKNNEFVVNTLGVQEVPYDVSFQIVDQYNKIHAKSDNANSIDRLPNYIEPSYLKTYLEHPNAFRFQDKKTGELFRVISSPLKDKNGNAIGTIIVGRSIESVRGLIRIYLLIMLVIGLPIAVAGLWLTLKWLKQHKQTQKTAKHLLNSDKVDSIGFNKNECIININENIIPLTYATNQYYLCLALFSAPKKKWELDELQEKMGEDIMTTESAWRKTYDAMNSINKKTDKYLRLKLVVTNNKTFQINPQLVNKIIK